MPKSTTVLFSRTLLAASIVSLSACSSLPQTQDLGLDKVGSGIVKAGKATASAGASIWNKTTYLLGFTDGDQRPGTAPTDDQLLLSEAQDTTLRPLPLPDREPVAIALPDTDQPIIIEQATAPAIQVTINDAGNEAAAADAPQAVIDDLVHVVSVDETLWDIAKRTTGDATNWHIIADVNNLEQNAAVYPGQELQIPGNIVKLDRVISESGETASVTSTLDSTAEQTASLQSTDDNASQTESPGVELADADAPGSTNSELDATAFDLNEGETLWDFSKRTTGDATNWQLIAGHNNFTDKQAVTVRAGQTIYVPQALLRDSAPGIRATSEAELTEADVADATGTEADVITDETTAEATSTTDVVAAALPAVSDAVEEIASDVEARVTDSSVPDATQSVEIVEAAFQSDDVVKPVDDGDTATQIVENANIPAQIMVSGTYYPKAVYNNADFSSSLLMRVSPGTTLQVSRAMGTWFEVETEKGVGYVHQRDIK